MAWATTLAVPGVPIRTRVSPLRPTVTGTSVEDAPQAGIARRRQGDAPAGVRAVRRGRRRPPGDVGVAVGARRLEQAELGDVAADRGLGDVEALLGERVDELALAADRRDWRRAARIARWRRRLSSWPVRSA